MVPPGCAKDKPFTYAIYALNGVLVVLGFVLILWGILTLREEGEFGSVEHIFDIYKLPPIAIALGLLIFIVATLGLVNNIYKKYYITLAFSVLLFITTVISSIAFIWLFVRRGDYIIIMDHTVEMAYIKNDKAHNYPFDSLEIALNCCGVVNYQDYDDKIPNTCCGYPRFRQNINCKKEIYSKRPGCESVFKEFWLFHINLVSVAIIFVILAELGLFWIACTLERKFQNSQKAKIEEQEFQS